MAERIDPKPGEILLDPACGTGGFLTCSIEHMRRHYVKTPKQEQKMQQALRAVEKKHCWQSSMRRAARSAQRGSRRSTAANNPRSKQ